MNSQERREARYQRRQARRQQKKADRCAALGPIEDVFSYRKMFFYGRKCCSGVRWKQSTQNFELHLFSGTARRRREVINGKWKQKKCTHFVLCERGKVRPIDVPHITDRQIHKTLCNEVLIPIYGPGMIYDNGASQKDKGLHWHFRRVQDQLRWHYRRYGRAGAVGLIDLKGFFPNAPHAALYQRHKDLILLGREALGGAETVSLEKTDAGMEITKSNEAGGIVFVTMAEAGNIDPVTAAEHADLFAEWAYPIGYTVGQIRRYKDTLYKCVQPHTSQADWTPDTAHSLWSKTSDPTDEWPEWVQPIGVHDAYALGAKVSHKEKHWTSNVANNVWEPGVYGWEEVL